MSFWEIFAVLEELAPEEEEKAQAPTPEEHDEIVARWG